mgnify:CR=1 FL=1
MSKEFEVTDDILATKQQRFANYIIDFIAHFWFFAGTTKDKFPIHFEEYQWGGCCQ